MTIYIRSYISYSIFKEKFVLLVTGNDFCTSFALGMF